MAASGAAPHGDGSGFSLANKSLKLDAATDLDAHVGPLKERTDWTSIALNGNTIGVPAAEALAPLLAAQTQLETINLADIFTGRLLAEIPAALEALLAALLQCPRLHTVDLSDNAFGLNTVAPLERFLRAHTPLQHLVLNNNGLGPTAGAKVADALTELAAEKEKKKNGAAAEGGEVPALESVVCGRNRLETGSMEAWARAFGAMPGMRSVKMTQNGIRQEGVVTLVTQGLAQCRSLEVLDLQDNTFTKTGSQALAATLPRWSGLQELGVGDCLLGARGFVLVAQALAQGQNKALRTIRAQYDEVDARGLAALVHAAADPVNALPALQRVELNGNRFAEDDAVPLQELLRARRSAVKSDHDADDDDEWGLDELSDLESDDEDEDEDEDEGSEPEPEPERAADAAGDQETRAELKLERREDRDEQQAKREKVLDSADLVENEEVAAKQDKEVDQLADALGKTL